MSNAVLLMVLRRSRLGVDAVLLPAASVAVATAVTLAAVSVAVRLWAVPDNTFSAYTLLGGALLVLLLVPLTALVNAATTLSTRRRDDRLSTLRLLGAPARLLRRIAVGEMLAVSALGTLAGLLAYIPGVPALALIPVQGDVLPVSKAWLPWQVIVITAVLIQLLVIVITAHRLRRVEISPLAVRIRSVPRNARARGIVIGGTVIVVALVAMQVAGQNWGVTGIAVGYVLGLSAIMSAMSLIGPVLTRWVATVKLNRAGSAVGVLAARGVLEDPKAAWRQVAPVAVATFIVVPAGTMLGYLSTIAANSDAVGPAELMLFADFRTVAIAAVTATFLIVGCSVSVTQASEILDRRATYVALERIGMSQELMQRTRRSAVAIPLGVATIGASIMSTMLVFVIVVISLFSSPLFFLGVIGLLVAGVLIVLAAVEMTRPVLSRVLAAPDRAL